MSESEHMDVPPDARGSRLDSWLAREEDGISRARWQQLIKEERVTVDGATYKPNTSLKGGERITYTIPPPDLTELLPEDIPLDVLYEDGAIIAINKPAGMVVHPAPGHSSGTLVNALLHHCTDLGGIGGELRPGIVHRLDKDTSGVILVAKTDSALNGLQNQFKNRETKKYYEAIVTGVPSPSSGTINQPIGRHPTQRKKMQANARNGRNAVTHYETLQAFQDAAHLSVRIETGRTHQIRVHLASIGHPVLGDTLYGKQRTASLSIQAGRQMLHAKSITFTHPETGVEMTLSAPLAADFSAALRQL
jgi:23S rRNA pseudouridine1911/1915/1917 synthase